MEAVLPSQAPTDAETHIHPSMWQLQGGSGGLPDTGEPGAWFGSPRGKEEGVC